MPITQLTITDDALYDNNNNNNSNNDDDNNNNANIHIPQYVILSAIWYMLIMSLTKGCLQLKILVVLTTKTGGGRGKSGQLLTIL